MQKISGRQDDMKKSLMSFYEIIWKLPTSFRLRLTDLRKMALVLCVIMY